MHIVCDVEILRDESSRKISMNNSEKKKIENCWLKRLPTIQRIVDFHTHYIRDFLHAYAHTTVISGKIYIESIWIKRNYLLRKAYLCSLCFSWIPAILLNHSMYSPIAASFTYKIQFHFYGNILHFSFLL